MSVTSVSAELRLAACAKVNLALRVLDRRADGYHELDMLIGFAPDAADAIEISRDDAISFTIDGPFADALMHQDARLNLVTRAATSLQEALDTRQGARIRLTKNLPVASGIGGGSADAAAVLKGLQTLWDHTLPPEELSMLALKLGADVPMCLHGAACHVSGIGEVVKPLDERLPGTLLLVNPGVQVATREVFAALDLSRCGAGLAPRPANGFATPQELGAYLAEMGNDLQPACIRLRPVVGDCIAAIATTPGCLAAQMTGSGATCFGLFATPAEARAAADMLCSTYPDWWVAVSRLG